MYKIDLTSPFMKRFRKLEKQVQKNCLADIQKHLQIDPFNIQRQANIKKLEGNLKGSYRLRSGEFRIVYSINNKTKTVSLETIKNRKDIYR